MPKFKVQFPNPVMYLDGHPKGYMTDHLSVNAPNAHDALVHAFRVVTGDVGMPTVTREEKTLAPPMIEAPVDVVEEINVKA